MGRGCKLCFSFVTSLSYLLTSMMASTALFHNLTNLGPVEVPGQPAFSSGNSLMSTKSTFMGQSQQDFPISPWDY